MQKAKREKEVPAVCYLVYTMLSERENFMGEGNLFPYMIVLLLAENNQRLATCLFKLLKWCPINEKINVRHLQSNVSAVLFTATLYIIGWTYQTILVFIILLLMDIWIVYSLWLL